MGSPSRKLRRPLLDKKSISPPNEDKLFIQPKPTVPDNIPLQRNQPPNMAAESKYAQTKQNR